MAEPTDCPGVLPVHRAGTSCEDPPSTADLLGRGTLSRQSQREEDLTRETGNAVLKPTGRTPRECLGIESNTHFSALRSRPSHNPVPILLPTLTSYCPHINPTLCGNPVTPASPSPRLCPCCPLPPAASFLRPTGFPRALTETLVL